MQEWILSPSGEVSLKTNSSVNSAGLLTGARSGRPLATWAGCSRHRVVLSCRTFTGTFSGRTSSARASGAAHGVLGRSLVARAVEGVLLAAGALGLGSADTAAITRGLAAGGGRVDHFDWMLV